MTDLAVSDQTAISLILRHIENIAHKKIDIFKDIICGGVASSKAVPKSVSCDSSLPMTSWQ